MNNYPALVTLDTGLVTGWFNAQRAQTLAGLSRSPLAGLSQQRNSDEPSARGPTDAVTPWDVYADRGDTEERLRKALSASSFFDETDRNLGGNNVHIDHKKLFALYVGLDSLQVIAGHAAKEETSSLLLSGLNRQFQEGLTEAFDYIKNLEASEYEVSAGEKAKRADADIAIKRTLSEFTGKIVHRDAVTEPMANLTGAESFNVSVTKSGVTTDVGINLADISGDLTLDNIVDHVNGELEAAGIITRLERVRILPEEESEDGEEDDEFELPPDRYGIKIQGVSTESISFSSDDAGAAIQLAGTSGKGNTEAGQLIKFTNADTTDPSLQGGPRIESVAPGDAEEEDDSVQANASATDSQGNTYVVGKTVTDIGAGEPIGESDAYISKYNSNGQLVWSRMLGASEEGEATSVAVDADDNVIVAGVVKGEADIDARGGGEDAFVTKLDSKGQTLFTRQIAPTADDAAYSLATGSDGSIYLTGMTEGKLALGETHGGGKDMTITKLDADGELAYQHQFGGAGEEIGRQVAVADDGNLIVASVEDGEAVVRKYDESDPTSGSMWEINLGSLNGGEIGDLVVDGSNVYLAGTTRADGLTGGTATELGTFHSGREGFLTKIDDAGASASASFTRYVGTAASDSINAITVHNGDVYLAGDTQGDLDGTGLQGTKDGFVARYDSDGNEIYTEQYAGRQGFASATGISVDGEGSSVLDVLGLPRGTIEYGEARTVTAQSSVRDGQYFYIAVDGGRQKKITIEGDDTLRELSRKIDLELGLKGEARVRRTGEGDMLRIEGEKGIQIELFAGDGADDALKGLGLKPGVIINEGSLLDKDDEEEDPDAEPETISFGLGLENDINLSSRTAAAYASQLLLDAMGEIRDAFRDLTKDPALEALLKSQKGTSGPVDPAISRQMANYQAGLARLENPSPTTGGFF